jgi:hypothetical protein
MSEKVKVLRNVLLKRVISKKKALELLNAKGVTEYEVILKYRGKDIIIYRDDLNYVIVDLFDAQLLESTGGLFD